MISDALIIGAGPSGLATARCLTQRGLTPVLLDREETAGASWRRHYDRLALHTARARSHLPGRPYPKSAPQYIPRTDVVAYLDDYAKGLDIRTGTAVSAITREGDAWRVTHTGGETLARAVVLATGFADTPRSPSWPGQDSFAGPILHSRAYKRPSDLPGDRVLVVGFGNSGGELAIDLCDAGREVTMAVRSPVTLLPKELFGIPIGNFELFQRFLPYRWADALTAPVLRWKLGDYSQYGLRKNNKGPVAQVKEDGQIPLIDLGTLALMREGRIKVKPGLTRFDGQTVQFTDGTSADFDAVLLATGYTVDLRPLLGAHPGLDDSGRPLRSGAEIDDGLWTISYHAVPNGQLREITRQAPIIADGIAQRAASSMA